MENNLQDQSTKSEVRVVSGITFALSRWKHILCSKMWEQAKELGLAPDFIAAHDPWRECLCQIYG